MIITRLSSYTQHYVVTMLEYDILVIRGNVTSAGQQQKQQNWHIESRDVLGHHIERWEQGPDYANEMETISEFRLHFRISSKFQNFA